MGKTFGLFSPKVYFCIALEGVAEKVLQPSKKQQADVMNWIILIIAGLCEVGFTYCLGRAKGIVGTSYWLWMSGFAALYVLSAVLLAKATENSLSRMDGHRSCWSRPCRHIHIQRTHLFLAFVLPYHSYCINHRTKSIVVNDFRSWMNKTTNDHAKL